MASRSPRETYLHQVAELHDAPAEPSYVWFYQNELHLIGDQKPAILPEVRSSRYKQYELDSDAYFSFIWIVHAIKSLLSSKED